MYIPDSIKQLDERQLFILGFCAYSGISFNEQNMMTLGKRIGQSLEYVKELMVELQEKGLMVTHHVSWSVTDRCINPRILLRLLIYIDQLHNDWLNIYLGYSNDLPSTMIGRMCNSIVNSIMCDQNVALPSMAPSTEEEMAVCLSDIICEPDLEDGLSHLPVALFRRTIHIKIDEYLANDIVVEDNIIDRLISRYETQSDTLTDLRHRNMLYRYFALGEMPEMVDNRDSTYMQQLMGFRQLYTGDYAIAVPMLEKGMRMRNSCASIKNVFHNCISNYLMILTYVRENSAPSLEKIGLYMSKKGVDERDIYQAAYVLAMYFRTPDKQIAYDTLRALLSENAYNTNRCNRYLAYLMVHYFNAKPELLQMPADAFDVFGPCPVPNFAILRHEMSQLLNLSDEERQQLTKLYGGDPVLTSIKVKTRWSLQLDDMMRDLQISDEMENSEVADMRVVYEVNPNDRESIEVREQNRLKNGTWGAGRPVTSIRMASGEYAQTEVDLNIWSVYKAQGTNGMPRLGRVLHHLVGTDKLVTTLLRSNRRTNVEVREEKPFISINRRKEAITIFSNVPSVALQACSEGMDVYTWRDENLIIYYPMTVRERHLFCKIMELGQLPLEAEAKMAEVLALVGDKVKIVGSMAEGSEVLPERDGEVFFCLQIVPEGSKYKLSMVVRPLREGTISCIPTDGPEVLFDTVDGQVYQVNRNMEGERETLRNLQSVLNDLDVTTIDDTHAILTVEQTLYLMEYAHEHQEFCAVEWPDGEKVHLSRVPAEKWSMKISGQGNWFELEGEVAINDEDVLSAGQMLLCMQGQLQSRFIRISDEQFITISEKLRQQLMRLESIAQINRGKVGIPQLGAGLMSDLFEPEEGEFAIAHPMQVEEIRDKILESQTIHFDVPKGLNATLRDYQEEGFRWMSRITYWGAGVCLADDMGLGKTLQTITFLLSKAEEGASLVLAPTSVVTNWQKEIAKFAPSLNVIMLNTNPDRKKAIEESGPGDVLVCSYGMLVSMEPHEEDTTADTATDADVTGVQLMLDLDGASTDNADQQSEETAAVNPFIEKKWNAICLDEAHMIKNRETKTSAVAMRMQGRYRLILTGTPIQNHLGELWNLFQFINPGLLGSYEQFSSKYINQIETFGNKERQAQLKRIVAPFMLRRTKQEVVEELPDKQEITIPVEMTKSEFALYELIRREAKQELETSQTVNINTLSLITKLRMAACCGSLARKAWKGNCSKIESFLELVDEINSGGNRVLVFSQFTSFLEMARMALEERGWKNAEAELSAKHDIEQQEEKPQRGRPRNPRFFYFDGQTNPRMRARMVEAFQAGQSQLFFISLRAGGLGITLTGANYVIHLDPWWNPAIEAQATDRAYRIGQNQKVTVYHLVSEHTIEEKILKMHQTKRDLANSLLEGTDMSHKITASDLLDMIDNQD